MVEIEISKFKYLEWIKNQLEDVETVEDLNIVLGYLPKEVVVKGFENAQEFLMEANKDNPVYFTFFIKEMIFIDSYGSDQIDIKWV